MPLLLKKMKERLTNFVAIHFFALFARYTGYSVVIRLISSAAHLHRCPFAFLADFSVTKGDMSMSSQDISA